MTIDWNEAREDLAQARIARRQRLTRFSCAAGDCGAFDCVTCRGEEAARYVEEQDEL